MKYLFIMILTMNSKNYKVIEIDDPVVNLMINEAFKYETCNFNSATIYHLESKKFLITPITGKYVILYSDLRLLKKHINDRCFPIEKYESDSIYEIEKENIKDIQNKESIYIKHILNKFDLNQTINNSTDEKLKNLNNKIEHYGYDNLSNYDILSIGVYVSHLFKVSTDSSWHLDKVFTLNTYWTPSLISKKKIKHDIIGDIFNTFYEHNFLDLIYSYRKEIAKLHGLTNPLSKKYLTFISTGVLDR